MSRSTRLRFQPRRYERSQYDLSQFRVGNTPYNQGFATAMRVRQTEDGPQLTLPQHSVAEERRILRNALSRLRDFDNRRATNNVTPEVGFSRQEVEQIGIWRLVDMAFQTSMRPSEQLLLRVDWEGQRPRTGPRQRFNAEEAGVLREGSLYSKRLTLTEGNYRDVIRRLASVDVEMEWGSDA